VSRHPNADDPKARWPGFATVNTEGAALAREMFIELEQIDYDAPSAGDLAQLENCYRQGEPFRNVVAQYLERAQAAGASVTEGFCAVLGDYIASCLSGSVPEVSYYDEIAGVNTGAPEVPS
jgi:hypothetical protein